MTKVTFLSAQGAAVGRTLKASQDGLPAFKSFVKSLKLKSSLLAAPCCQAALQCTQNARNSKAIINHDNNPENNIEDSTMSVMRHEPYQLSFSSYSVLLFFFVCHDKEIKLWILRIPRTD